MAELDDGLIGPASRNSQMVPGKPGVNLWVRDFFCALEKLERCAMQHNLIDARKGELVALHEKVQDIIERADSAARELTNREIEEVERIQSDFDRIAGEVGIRERLASDDELMSTSAGRKSLPDGMSNPGTAIPSRLGGRGVGRPLFKDLGTGKMIEGYSGTQPFSPQNDADLGGVLRGILLNDMSDIPRELQSAMTTGSDSSGGYLVPSVLSERVIDLARANSVVMRAGAMTLPMDAAEMAIARVTGDPTTAWRAETGAVTASVPTFGRYYLRPKTLAAIVPVSMELLEDTPNAGSVIEQTLMAALGVEMDRVLLEGTGAANEPRGIANTSGVNSQTGVGTPSNYSQITTAVRDILAANYPGEIQDLAWVMNPTVGGTYDGLVTGISSDNTPLEPTPWVRQLMRLYTTNLAATGSPQSYNTIVGDFSQLLVGMRTSGVVIDVVDGGSVTDSDSISWNATSQFLRHVRARIRVDSVVMQPGFFSVLSGVNA